MGKHRSIFYADSNFLELIMYCSALTYRSDLVVAKHFIRDMIQSIEEADITAEARTEDIRA